MVCWSPLLCSPPTPRTDFSSDPCISPSVSFLFATLLSSLPSNPALPAQTSALSAPLPQAKTSFCFYRQPAYNRLATWQLVPAPYIFSCYLREISGVYSDPPAEPPILRVERVCSLSINFLTAKSDSFLFSIEVLWLEWRLLKPEDRLLPRLDTCPTHRT